MTVSGAQLVDKFRAEEATIGIIGLGYVGLPLALTFGRKKVHIVGFDVDGRKLGALAEKRSYLRHIPSERIAGLVETGRFQATDDFSRSKECDAVIICVPTPLSTHREPDMSYVRSTAEAIGPHLRRGQLIVLESTTYPGTTEELLRGILEEHSGLTAGEDFLLAYSPEREDPGNPDFDTQRIPKVVGGLTPACRDAAVALYELALDQIVTVSKPAVAEATKLLENIFRGVNIALVNEMKILCDHMGIDVWEVIEAASTKPFGFMPFFPGPGLGGHCIPIDPFYLTWKAREYDLSTRFIELAGEINTDMPRYVIRRLADALNDRCVPLNGARILILGVAYKRDVDDVRESPALRILDFLSAKGAEVCYHDPFVPTLEDQGRGAPALSSVALSAEAISGADAVMIITDHTNIDYTWVAKHAALVIDTRNATRDIPEPLRAKVVKA